MKSVWRFFRKENSATICRQRDDDDLGEERDQQEGRVRWTREDNEEVNSNKAQ